MAPATIGRVTETSAPEPTFVDDRIAHWAVATPDADAVTYGPRT